MSGGPQAVVIAFTQVISLPLSAMQEAAARRLGQNQGTPIERLVEFAGRTCYDSYGRGRPSEAFHMNILTSGHGSVLEHGALTFLIAGVSRGLTHELVRHRHGSYSQRSTRYVDESESPYAWHPLITADDLDAVSGDLGSEPEVQAAAAYGLLCGRIEARLVEAGVSQATARKQARGAARGALGNALATVIVASWNLRALRGLIEQRATEFADSEIRLLANRLYEAAYPFAPQILSDYERYEHPDMAGIGYGLKTANRKV